MLAIFLITPASVYTIKYMIIEQQITLKLYICEKCCKSQSISVYSIALRPFKTHTIWAKKNTVAFL